MTTESSDKEELPTPAVGYVHTTNLPGLLHQLQSSLFVTTYQAQRLMTFNSVSGEKISMWMRVFPRPTGLALKHEALVLGTKNQIWTFRPVTGVRDQSGELLPYQVIYSPRESHVTGDIAVHQLGWIEDELWFVNTRFSCLCTLDRKHSFIPRWKPPFISNITPEDRCHLNGFCLRDGTLAYATALGKSDTKEGWRSLKASGGVVIDVQRDSILAEGLSMPHSPIWHQGKLWVLESGTGALVTIDERSGEKSEICRFPGFLRGLTFFDRYAIIGTSKIREKDQFGGLPIEDMYDELKCAIYFYDFVQNQTVAFIEFTKGIEELFDIRLLPGVTTPHIIGFEEDTIDGLISLPNSFEL